MFIYPPFILLGRILQEMTNKSFHMPNGNKQVLLMQIRDLAIIAITKSIFNVLKKFVKLHLNDRPTDQPTN